MIKFKIEGTPLPQPRPRTVTKNRFGNPLPFARTYTPSSVMPWRQAIAWQSKSHRPPSPYTGPLRVDTEFVMPRPKGHFNRKGGLRDSAPRWWHDHRPDEDNLKKAVYDVLTEQGFWLDDGQIALGLFCRRYAEPGEVAGVVITIDQLLLDFPPEPTK